VALRDVRDLDRSERQRWSNGKLLPATGALVSRIWRNAPAARAGLRPGDVIVSVNARQVPTPADLADLIATQEVGAQLVLEVVREGALRSIPLSLEEQPTLSEVAPN
jgi:serine protease Do